MPDEFQTIQEQLKRMEGQMALGFTTLKTEVGGLKNGVVGLEDGIKALREDQEKHFTALKIDVDALQSDVQTLQTDVLHLETNVQKLETNVQRVERITSTTLEIVQGERDERINLGGRVGILEEDMVTMKEKVGLKAVKVAV